MFSAICHISNKIGVAYVRGLPLPTLDKFVKFDGVVLRNAPNSVGTIALLMII